MEGRKYIFVIGDFYNVIILTKASKKAFNGHQENDDSLIPLINIQIYVKVNKVHHIFGKAFKKSSLGRKKGIFFDLPY